LEVSSNPEMASEGSGKLRFGVRLTPKGGRDGFDGWAEGPGGARYLKARVAAPPHDGMANEALVRMVAKTLKLAPSKVRIVSGATSRLKTIEVEAGRDLAQALAALGKTA
jgi:uncharacterized protein (TIGR00251 family)